VHGGLAWKKMIHLHRRIGGDKRSALRHLTLRLFSFHLAKKAYQGFLIPVFRTMSRLCFPSFIRKIFSS